MPTRAKYTALDDALYEYMAAHRTPDDDVVRALQEETARLGSSAVMQNVTLPMELAHRYTPRERRQRALHLLDLVEIAGHAHKRPAAVSGGQQQRVAIARAMANDPAILVADEPTGSLDSATADAVLRVFERLVDEENKTVILVTHDRDIARRGSRRVHIADGEIRDEGAGYGAQDT